MLGIIETHPIQYHAPVYRALQQQCDVPVTVIYGSDFSVAGYRDQEFGASFAWDTDLLSGYSSMFLSRVSTGGAATFDAVSTRGLRSALRRVNPDVIMVVGYSPHFNRVAWREARRTGRPILFRGETSDDAHARGWFKTELRRAVLGLAYRSCEHLLYIGVRSREHFEHLGVPADRLVFSPYCVDTSVFELDEAARARLRQETRRRLKLSDDRIVLLFSGKLSDRKGVDLLVEAARSLQGSLRNRAALLVVGDGELRESLEATARQDPAITAIFTGFQNQRQLSPFYHAADLLVLPSRRLETWGLVVNEALHHGLPCVVSDHVGCAPDLIRIGVTGTTCEAGSAASLNASIVAATALCGRPDVRARCRGLASRYSVSKAAEGIAVAVRSAIARRPVAEQVS